MVYLDVIGPGADAGIVFTMPRREIVVDQ